jgi:soluble lytic murein transglycosylase-like protein
VPGGPSQQVLDRIAACESGGNPRAVSASGQYRGKYQFDPGTWRGVGGSGDPAAASEAEQDLRAAILYARSGPAPWPVCGYR